MLNLTLMHRNNQAGKKLLDLLLESPPKVDCKETSINGISFLEIMLPGDSKTKRVLNSPQSLINCLDRKISAQMLGLSGIGYDNSSKEMIIKYYDVLVFDMEIISIKARAGDSSQGKYVKESENVKIAELARTTIYILGLDYGMVNIAVTGKRKNRVVDIDDSPAIRKKDRQILLNKIILRRDLPPTAGGSEVTMGADPEFMLFNAKSGKMIAASNFFPREGIVGCDNIRIPNRQQRPVAELRPQPTTSPRELTNNIKAALARASQLAPYRNVRWVAGSQPLSGYSIGGHIHFSNIDISCALLRALDNYLGITVFLIENPISAARRRKKYGHLADIRFKDYGGFEYRTPGSWLVTPEITCAVLCLAKIIVQHYFELNSSYLNSIEALQAFYEGKQEYFRPLFDKLWQEIAATSRYSEYEKELQILPEMINNYIIWDEKQDLKAAWKMEGGAKRNYSSNSYKGGRSQPLAINAPANRGRRNVRAVSSNVNSSSASFSRNIR